MPIWDPDGLLSAVDRKRADEFNDFDVRQSRHSAKVQAQQSVGLKRFATTWDDVTRDDAEALTQALLKASDERPLQQVLSSIPKLLVQMLGGGHGRWVIPQVHLGAEFRPDFLVAEASSLGLQWVAIELESPLAQIFNRRGDPSKELNHAIRQIADWRTWLTQNIDYATKPREHSGLELIDIDGTIPGIIIIGRRDENRDALHKSRRRQIGQQQNIAIHTYDWLLDFAIEKSNRNNATNV
jgi:hypothetical protein